MKKHYNCLNISIFIIFILPALAFGYNEKQLPSSLQMEIHELSIKFRKVLLEECPQENCLALGCRAINYLVLQEEVNTPLPGFSIPKKDKVATPSQYRLTSAQCEMAYEPELDKTAVKSIVERTSLIMSKPQLNINILSRKLSAKKPLKAGNGDDLLKSLEGKELNQKNMLEGIWKVLLPHFPWMLPTVLFGLLGFFAIFYFLAIKKRDLREFARKSENQKASQSKNVAPQIIFEKSDLIRNVLVANPEIAKDVIQPFLNRRDMNELCLFLSFFGPTCFEPLRQEPKNFAALEELSLIYSEYKEKFDPTKGLDFLDKVEQLIAGVQVKLKTRPVSEEFRFLDNMTDDEFLAIIRNLSEDQIIAVVTHASQEHVSAFIKTIGTEKSRMLVEKLMRYDSLSESFVRETASIVRERYNKSAGKFRNILLDKVNVIEGVVNLLPKADRKEVFEQLKNTESKNAHSEFADIFLDDSLPYLPIEILDDLFLNIDQKLIIPYLKNLSKEIRTSTLEKINTKLAAVLLNKLEKYDTDIDTKSLAFARKKVSEFVKNQARNGKIDLAEINKKFL